MYDTIKMHLTPLYLDRGYMRALLRHLDYYEPKNDKQNGWQYFKGSIKNMGVTADDYRGVKIYGSLPKYLHGNNVGEFHRAEVEQAINELSERLHIPLEHAKVLRLDVGANIEVTNPVEMYLPYLGVLPKFQRETRTARNLYYHGGGGTQVMEFYDKLADLKVKDPTLYLEYANKNIVRYELRYLYRVSTRFKQPVTGALLYEPNFYNGIVDRWGQIYTDIQKNKIINPIGEMKATGTKAHFNDVLLINFINAKGGLQMFDEWIRTGQAEGYITKQRAYQIRTRVKKMLENKALLSECELIDELTKKIADRVSQEKTT